MIDGERVCDQVQKQAYPIDRIDSQSTICVEQKQPAIVFLDENQRYEKAGNDVESLDRLAGLHHVWNRVRIKCQMGQHYDCGQK
jgi:hypothetical protein